MLAHRVFAHMGVNSKSTVAGIVQVFLEQQRTAIVPAAGHPARHRRLQQGFDRGRNLRAQRRVGVQQNQPFAHAAQNFGVSSLAARMALSASAGC